MDDCGNYGLLLIRAYALGLQAGDRSQRPTHHATSELFRQTAIGLRQYIGPRHLGKQGQHLITIALREHEVEHDSSKARRLCSINAYFIRNN